MCHLVFMYMVQLYKEDWTILHILGCQAIALPSTEQIAICYVKSGKKPTLAQICKIISIPVHRYRHQFDQLVFHQGVLHRVYEQDGAKYHQLILPIEFSAQVMEILNDEQSHEAVVHTLQLVQE